MVKDNSSGDMDEILHTAHRMISTGDKDMKTWAYCQDCTIMGTYEWCPKKKETTKLDVEEGCPMGKRILH